MWTANSWVKVNVAGASSHLDATKPENRIAKITELALLEVKHVPGLPYRSETAGHFVMASVDDALHGRRTGGRPFDVRRCVAQP